MEKRNAVIFDMDGTLCDVRSIRHLVKCDRPDFDAFHRASASCPPNADVVEAAHKAKADGRDVLVVSARMEQYRRLTSMWLALHEVPSDLLLMRKNGDFRKDFVVKKEILDRIRRKWHVTHAWDDNPNVLNLWRSESIPVTEVPGWDD